MSAELNKYGDPMSLQAGHAVDLATGFTPVGGVVTFDSPVTLFIGTAGNVELTAYHSTVPVIYTGVQGNLPVLVKSVSVGGNTTASNIIVES